MRVIIGRFITTVLAAVLCLVTPLPAHLNEEFRFENTVINGIDVSGLTQDEALHSLSIFSPDIKVTCPDGKEYILCNLNRIGSLSFRNKMQDIIRNGITGQVAVKPEVYFQKDELRKVMTGFVNTYNIGKRQPENARIEFRDGRFNVNPGRKAEALDAEKVYKKICCNIDQSMFDISLATCLQDPKIPACEIKLSDEMIRINEIKDIVYGVKEGAEGVIEEETIRRWITYKNHVPGLSTHAITTYIKEIAGRLDTFGTKREFVTHTGDKIMAGGSEKDTFGWELDVDRTVEALERSILEGEPFELEWENKGVVLRESNDIGRTYVEVSIADQHLWYIKDGKCLLETDVVTGSTLHGGTTPGVFKVLYKESPAILRGDDYETPVQYWMPVTYTGTGLHDANWRRSFGGNIYTYNGSHGCVNMPSNMARDLYGMIETGTPVVIY